MSLLEVNDLTLSLPRGRGHVKVVDGLSFAVEEGQVIGIAGESGSGKTVSTLALLGLVPRRSKVGGTTLFQGRDLLRLSARSLRRVRGKEIAMVFQDPMTSLHPMLSVETQLTEHVRKHLGTNARGARRRAVELLEEVRFPDPEGALAAFPHQFSGGMRQRLAIAIALACRPKLLIADEPTTDLDVTVQAGIIRLLARLREEEGISVILITHDLGVMSSLAEWVTVMYGGRVVESAATADVIRRPRHPYTEALLAALPQTAGKGKLVPIAGSPPHPAAMPAGCAFHPRCGHAIDVCKTTIPELAVVAPGRSSACHVDPFREPAR